MNPSKSCDKWQVVTITVVAMGVWWLAVAVKEGRSSALINQSIPIGNGSQCPNLSDVFEEIGRGWQKKVLAYSENLVLKRPANDGVSFRNCVKVLPQLVCEEQLKEAFIDEIEWLQKLQWNENVVKLFLFCIDNVNVWNSYIVVERGLPLTSLYLVQLNHEMRKNIIWQIFNYLRNVPNVRFTDFRRQQFITVNDTVKLTDADHLVEGHEEGPYLANRFYDEFLPFLFMDLPNSSVPLADNLWSLRQRNVLKLSDFELLFAVTE